MSNYYSECLDKVERLIAKGEFEEASKIIDEELKMIYIPQEFEEKMKDFRKQIQPVSQKKQLSDEQIEAYLRKDEFFQLLAIKELSQRNLRQYLDLAQEILTKSQSKIVKISMIECLVEQQITDEMNLCLDGFEISFIPSALTLPNESDAIDSSLEYLKQWLENENPTFYELCREALIQEAYLHLPFEIDESESEALAYAIVMYVSERMDCKDFMKKTLYEKNASQNGNFELLLYSNTI